ncbi:unnamed protein product [Phytomonas sp. Hart1]|nr:unnamed protein product [Phytomonas sp. Hart1]|eukprot:CCW71090.1 unnamed protein product [Phytomonas sp. isolate Hart1]
MNLNSDETTCFDINESSTLPRNTKTYTMDEILPYLTEQETKAIEQEVFNTLNNELVSLESLDVTVPRLLRSCASESKELRQVINAIVSSQIVESQRALQMVEEGGNRLQNLRELFLRQGKLIKDMGCESKSYTHLRQLHLLRENVGSVIDWSLALTEVHYGNLYRLVQKREFVLMYDRLKRLQRIRRSVITKAGAQYHTFQCIFEPYFSKLDTVLELFVQEIYAVFTNDAMGATIQKALYDTNTSFSEGKGGKTINHPSSSLEFNVLKECVQVCSQEVQHPVLNFGSDGVERVSLITKDKILDAISKNITTLWKEQIAVGGLDPFEQPMAFLEQMRKVEPLLEALEMVWIPLSSAIPFFAVVVRTLHSEVLHAIGAYVQPHAAASANTLMEASHFMAWYKEMLSYGNYGPHVERGSVEDLAAALMTRAVGGLTEHLTSLCRACARNTFKAPKGPTILPSGRPITTGPMDIFAALQQTLDGLSASIELSVMRTIGSACAEGIYCYLQECRRCCDFYFWEAENDASASPQTPEEWQQRRMLLLYAYVNDSHNIEGNLDTIEMKFYSCWDYDMDEAGEQAKGTEREKGLGPMPFLKVQDTLSESAFYYLDEITAQVEMVVGAQWAMVFREGEWYGDKQNPIQIIMSTVCDYIREEFMGMLPHQWIRRLTRQMFIRFVEKYLSTCMEFLGDVIRKPKTKIVKDWPTFLSSLVRDAEFSMTMWRPFNLDRPLLELGKKALELLTNLLTAKKPTEFKFFLQGQLLDDFGDCPSFVIGFVLQARPHEISAEVQERMLAIWQELIAHQKRNPTTDLPTTGWSQPTSFYGAIDRSIVELGKTTRLFGKSAKKKRLQKQTLKEEQEKKAALVAYNAQKQANPTAEAAKKKLPTQNVKTDSGTVEMALLSDILK